MPTKTKKKSKPKKKAKKGILYRLVAPRNLAKRLEMGWKESKNPIEDCHGRVLGVRTNANDLILMEKKI